MNELIIYGYPPSTYVRTARMTCEEKGIEYTLDPFKSFEFKSPEHLKLHPFGKMPAMRHGDLVLYETSAIAKYIDENFSGPDLQPKDAAERARMNQWISAICDYIYKDVIIAWILSRSHDDEAKEKEALKEIAAKGNSHLKAVNVGYGNSDYLVGNSLTLADLFWAPIISYVMARSAGMVESHANVNRAWSVIKERSSFRNTEPPPSN